MISNPRRSASHEGLPWGATLPDGWKVIRVKHLLSSIVAGGTPTVSDERNWTEVEGFGWVSIGDMTKQPVVRTTGRRITEAGLREKNLRVLPPGTLLYSMYASLGKVAVLAIPAATNQAILGLVPKSEVAYQPFLRWCLEDLQRNIGFLARSNTQDNINAEQVANLPIPVPPTTADQRAIADFLDEKTAAIDALIAKKERLIELIEEKRQAAITSAVTKGVDLDMPMKGSGVEWIGDVPAHWMVVQTRVVARLESGHTPSRQHPEYWIPEECVVPWFTLADVWQIRDGRREYLGDTAEKVSPAGLANSSARLLPAGTVVLSRTASVGYSGIMPRPMATSQDFVNWVCGDRILPEYLLYVLRAMTPEFRRLMMGSTHQTIYMPDVRGFRTPLPPVEEQGAIVTSLKRTLASYERLRALTERQVDRLREYRHTLISAAVTGRIDVRSRSTRTDKVLQEALA